MCMSEKNSAQTVISLQKINVENIENDTTLNIYSWRLKKMIAKAEVISYGEIATFLLYLFILMLVWFCVWTYIRYEEEY